MEQHLMICFHPLKGYQAAQPNASGKYSTVFSRKEAGICPIERVLKCGQCTGCRLRYSAEWATRCTHEAMMHEQNCVITLTYDNKSLPKHGSLKPSDFVAFMKKFRRKLLEESGVTVRFYMCGEYGDEKSRPHYHAVIFGWYPPDAELVGKSKSGFPMYRSDILTYSWPHGIATVGDFHYKNAAYIARYMMKKHRGKDAHLHYQRMDPETGEIVQLVPEYCNMSRRGGIGRDWFDKYSSDVFPHDFCVIDGKKMPTPRYYFKLLEKLDQKKADEIARRRVIKAKAKAAALEKIDLANWWAHGHTSLPRLHVQEKVLELRLSKLKRGYEYYET